MNVFTMDNVKNLVTVATMLGIGYTVVSSAGWVLSRAEAQTMIELAVQSATAQTNAALLDEVKARQLADLTFQLQGVNEEIATLLNSGALSPAEQDELEQLKKERDRLNTQIAGLQ